MSPPAILNETTYADLVNISTIIEDPSKTIIISRHGLEWWVGWTLETKIGQVSAIDEDLFNSYTTVLYLNEINLRHDHKRPEPEEDKPNPFSEPEIPEGSELVYSSEHFNVYWVTGI